MLENLINDLRSTTKPSKKQEIVEYNDSYFLKHILKATFEPFKKYHVKIKPTDIPLVKGVKSIDDLEIQEEFIKLIYFCEQSKSNKQNRLQIVKFLKDLNEGSQDIVVGTLNKNWKVGLSHKTVLKLYPNLISVFEVQLANNYLAAILKKKYQAKERYCSYKLDGVRCIFIRLEEEGKSNWVAFSRQGKEFLTVDHLKPQLELLWELHGIDFWDGELYIPGAPFEYIQGEVMRFTKGTSYELEYRVFICGDKDMFLKASYINSAFKIVTDEYLNYDIAPKIVLQEQWLIPEDKFMAALEEAFELGYEGIMLRDPDKLYDFKRSDMLLKLKENDTDQSQEEFADCVVKDIVIDSFPVVINETMIYKQLLTKLIVEQADEKICTVGSGFDLRFRYKCTENPEDILNKVVEIKFQGYGSKGRMRFPRLHRVREDLTWGE